MSERVEIEIRDGIAEVRLNRPEKKNALDPAFFTALAEAGESLQGRPELRAVVMYGKGGCFCAGLDTSGFANFARDMEETRRRMLNPPEGQRGNLFQRPTLAWQEIEVPVIAAIEGVAFGGGLQLALAADFRFCAPDARLSIMEARWGLVPDMGITATLPQLMPADRAKDLMMTGRIVSAEEALALNLVTRIEADPIAAAMDYARALCDRNPEAVRGCKRLVDEVWGRGDAGLRLEAELQAAIIGGPNQMETVMAELERRKPRYR